MSWISFCLKHKDQIRLHINIIHLRPSGDWVQSQLLRSKRNLDMNEQVHIRLLSRRITDFFLYNRPKLVPTFNHTPFSCLQPAIWFRSSFKFQCPLSTLVPFVLGYTFHLLTSSISKPPYPLPSFCACWLHPQGRDYPFVGFEHKILT